ncbi:MAG: carboxypeptidase-like regulatory domain-containing protein [Acidobacteriaceae bacterium]
MQSRTRSACRRLWCFGLSGLFVTLAPALVCAQQSSPVDADGPLQATDGPPIAVHGMVINAASGSALPRALVRIDGSEVLAALTGSDGSFTIDGVPSGSHQISVQRPNFQEFSGAADALPFPSHSFLAAAGMAPLTLSLSPLNAIRLHLSLSTGLPPSTIGVSLFRQMVLNGRHAWMEADNRQTTPAGQIRFARLSDGAYLVASRPEFGNVRARDLDCGPSAPPMMPGFAAVFLPSSQDSAGAPPIHVSGGQTADASFELAPTIFYLVRVAVGHAPVADGWKFAPTLLSGSGEFLPYKLHEDKDHSLCTYLPDGAYSVALEATRESDNVPSDSASEREARDVFGSLDFTVDGAALPGLRLALAPSALTPIHLHYEPAPPAPPRSSGDEEEEERGEPLDLNLDAAHRVQPLGASAPEANAGEDGRYFLRPAVPGSYWIHAEAGQNGVCLGAVTAGGEDAASAPWIAGPSGSGPPIDVTLRTDCAQIKLQLGSGAATGGAADDSALYAYAVPLFPSLQNAASAQIQPLTQRTAEFDDLTPGPWRIFLFRSPHSLAFREPGALDALGSGQDVTLEPGEHQTITLTGPAQ